MGLDWYIRSTLLALAASLFPWATGCAETPGPADAGASDVFSDASVLFGECPTCYYSHLVSGGTSFHMGCPQQCEESPEALPVHLLWLSGFMIRTFEVAQGDYQLCMADSSCSEPGGNYDPVERGDYPVTNVTWEQASEYCIWAGGNLPTEAQWEYAARRMGSSRDYPWDFSVPPDCELANYDGCNGKTVQARPAPGTHPNNYKMHIAGNVAEWVFDYFDPDYYANQEPFPNLNPMGPADGEFHVVRGGGFRDTSDDIRVWVRKPGSVDDDVGFRCVLPID